jgi:hypothetical protein
MLVCFETIGPILGLNLGIPYKYKNNKDEDQLRTFGSTVKCPYLVK